VKHFRCAHKTDNFFLFLTAILNRWPLSWHKNLPFAWNVRLVLAFSIMLLSVRLTAYCIQSGTTVHFQCAYFPPAGFARVNTSSNPRLGTPVKSSGPGLVQSGNSAHPVQRSVHYRAAYSSVSRPFSIKCPFLAYFPYFEKLKVGLCALHAVCVSQVSFLQCFERKICIYVRTLPYILHTLPISANLDHCVT
jgi:hypothetical protein